MQNQETENGRKSKTSHLRKVQTGNGEVIFDEPVAADRIKVTVMDSFNEIDYKLACIGEIHVYKAILPEHSRSMCP